MGHSAYRFCFPKFKKAIQELTFTDAPQIFKAVGAGDASLLISGFFGVVKVVSCLFFLLFLVERIGRRGSLLGGAFLMGVYMLIIAVLSAVYPPVEGQGVTPTGAASVTMVYLEASQYSCLIPRSSHASPRTIGSIQILVYDERKKGFG